MQTSAQTTTQLLNLLALLQTKQTLETLENLKAYKEFCYQLYLFVDSTTVWKQSKGDRLDYF